MAEKDIEEVNKEDNKSKKEEMWFELLPIEITLDILVRLPKKSIIRLRCTCRFFRTFLTEPLLTKLHFARVRNSIRELHRVCIIQ